MKEDNYSDRKPNVGVTVSPFIYEDEKIKVLLYKRSDDSEMFGGLYSLPNRFFDITKFSDLEASAVYALEEKANVKIPEIIQFETFSGQYIDPKRETTVNVCYLSILRHEDVKAVSENDDFDTVWMPIDDALKLELAFNHNEVLEKAYKKVLSLAEYTVLPISFLSEKFTITELRSLTEILIDQKIDNARFRDRIKKSGILVEVDGEWRKGANRPAQLFVINKDYEGNFYPKNIK